MVNLTSSETNFFRAIETVKRYLKYDSFKEISAVSLESIDGVRRLYKIIRCRACHGFSEYFSMPNGHVEPTISKLWANLLTMRRAD